ncbi:4-(cytidine 5'-diphospho)-2-C-methyl-D-erythritol kinase [uncultured Sphingomonas sp.]|uniref:4-(cytidine 5'-diphospho)-2-C-methyl-D-erythritol kinase n=1 Tax=uncultured Sphingomonas sp. TaxID=158754 RepID=UPI0026120FFC|nr:4-(cytidine 5'-diphospho)-2-C-methyl-D-erythritol kinase [uncultured Sphingomonas sp.]
MTIEGTRDAIIERAPAKLNLALHVRRRRSDGYHDIETLFAFCRDGDAISLAPARSDSFAINGPFGAALAREGDNLVTRARDAFRAAFGDSACCAIVLEKNLPVASGIGGGSADAAATLRALARRHGVALDDARLFEIAARLGADVPACLMGQSAIGYGRGDDLRPIAGLGGKAALLVNPGAAVSTARVFAGWDGEDRGPISGGDPAGDRNDLTAAAIAIAPVIASVLGVLERQPGVELARMSGSGATCFALFDTASAAHAATGAIAARQPDWWILETSLA